MAAEIQSYIGVDHKIVDDVHIVGGVLCQRVMIHHKMAAYKECRGAGTPLAMEHDVELLAFSLGLTLTPVEVEVDKCLVAVVLHQGAADVVLEIGQRVAPEESGELLAQLGARKHTQRKAPEPLGMAVIDYRAYGSVVDVVGHGLIPHRTGRDAVVLRKLYPPFYSQVGKKEGFCLGILIVALAVVEHRPEVDAPCRLHGRQGQNSTDSRENNCDNTLDWFHLANLSKIPHTRAITSCQNLRSDIISLVSRHL